MSQVFSLIQYTSTSYSLFELADLYSKVKSKNFKYKFIYPTFLVIEDELIPISA